MSVERKDRRADGQGQTGGLDTGWRVNKQTCRRTVDHAGWLFDNHIDRRVTRWADGSKGRLAGHKAGWRVAMWAGGSAEHRHEQVDNFDGWTRNPVRANEKIATVDGIARGWLSAFWGGSVGEDSVRGDSVRRRSVRGEGFGQGGGCPSFLMIWYLEDCLSAGIMS